jgi:hypothetical protein
MYFPRFWQRAQTGEVITWGWSNTSIEEALAKARERQARVLAWLKEAKRFDERGQYGYPDRPMREEVLREFPGDDGEAAGVLTRNSYGCIVLNTARLAFVDVDTPSDSGGSVFGRLFGKKYPDPQSALELALTEKLRAWIAARPDWRWRMYRTAAGVRLMAVHRPLAPDNALVTEAFEHFAADPLYRALCKTQRCFRARLTPKPWRCAADQPPCSWPWPDAAAEGHFRDWEREYLEKIEPYATCRLLEEFGGAPSAVEFAEMVKTHDRSTRAETELPLA